MAEAANRQECQTAAQAASDEDDAATALRFSKQ